MLEALEIRDFALIDNVRVDWMPGLNVLTGETGAGKSIIIDALNAVLGGKTGPSFIRNGSEKASIEASFKVNPIISAWLKKQELIDEELNSLIVSREITKSSSRIRVNGTLVNSAIVQELAQILLTIHAQHEARTLMSSQAQLEMLDSLGDQAHRKRENCPPPVSRPDPSRQMDAARVAADHPPATGFAILSALRTGR